MLDRVLDGIELPAPDRDPRTAIVEGFSASRRALLAHPTIVLLMTERARFTRSQARLATRSISLFEEPGLSTHRAVEVHVTLVAFVLGFILQEVSRPAAPGPALLEEIRCCVGRSPRSFSRHRTNDSKRGWRVILDGALGSPWRRAVPALRPRRLT